MFHISLVGRGRAGSGQEKKDGDMLRRQPLEAAKEMRAHLEAKPTPELIKLAVACRNGIVQNRTDEGECRTGLDFVLEALGTRMPDAKFKRFCGGLGAP